MPNTTSASATASVAGAIRHPRRVVCRQRRHGRPSDGSTPITVAPATAAEGAAMATDRPMRIGMVGLGRMGANLSGPPAPPTAMRSSRPTSTRRRSPKRRAPGVIGPGRRSTSSSPRSRAPRAVWIMVPAGRPTDAVVADLAAAARARGRPARRRQHALRRRPPARRRARRGRGSATSTSASRAASGVSSEASA